jgi:hypothetical protein
MQVREFALAPLNHKCSLCRLLLAIQGKWILAHIHSGLLESLRSMLASFRSAQQPTNQSELFEGYSILGKKYL